MVLIPRSIWIQSSLCPHPTLLTAIAQLCRIATKGQGRTAVEQLSLPLIQINGDDQMQSTAPFRLQTGKC